MDEAEIQRIKQLIKSGYYEGTIFSSGVIYKGGLYQGLAHGKGTIILPSGNSYNYEFRNGRLADGRAIIVYPDGSFYEGEVSSSNQPYGKAIIRNSDGSIYYQGNWDHDHDPKTVWLCGPYWWYEDGEIFHVRPATVFEPSIHLLHRAVCLKMPSLWDENFRAEVMFPHLRDLGCPNSDNSFTLCPWRTTPEKAVQYAGFKDLDDYWEWTYVPELKILERLKTGVEITEYGMKIFGLFHEHNMVHTIADKGLGFFKKYLDKEIEDYRKQIG